MLIDTTLLAENAPVIEGLRTGSLKRFGGVVRDTKTGRIVHHLLEAPGTSEALMKAPVANLPGAAGRSAHAVGRGLASGGVNASLEKVLGVAQVGAAASVLNLGVSIAGFAYMGYKLHRLERSIAAVQERMEAGFARVEAKLGGIAEQLDYVLLLTSANAREQRRIGDALAELHRAFLMTELAELRSWLDQLSRFPEDSPKDAIRSASRARHVLSDQAVRAKPELEPGVMVVADIAIRGWVVATATEAHLLMNMGMHREARELIEREQPQFVELAERWAEALLADERPELRTALRFEAPRFRPFILPERVERIVRVHRPDRERTDERRRRASQEAALELEMSHNAELDENWTHRQLAIAEYLDGLSELSSRLEAVGAFARECEVRNLPSSRAALPGADAKPGIYVLPAAADGR